MNDAVFRLRSSSGYGTAFLVSRRLALTAAHCVEGATELQLESKTATVGARVMGSEATLDAALLTLRDPNALDGVVRAVRIGTLPDGRPLADFRWHAPSFAVGDTERLGLELTGSLAGIQRMGEIRRLQLNCDQFGADSGGIAGSSGSPVTVNGFAVALVSRAPKAFKQRVVFATMLEDVLQSFRGRVEAEYRDEFEALLVDVVAIELDECDRALNRYVARVKRLGRSFHERAVRTPACSTRRIEQACLEATYIPIRLQQVREAHELWVDSQDVGCTTDIAPLDPPVDVEGAIQSAFASSSRLQLLITGYAGTGKTTVLSHLASQALLAPESIGLPGPMTPLLLSLPELARARCSSNLSDWLVEARVQGAAVCDLPSSDWSFVIEFPLRLGAPILLLFDGLDEVPEQLRRDLWRSFRLCVVEGGYSWMMASRPATSHEDPVNDISQRSGVYTYKIQPWSDEELNQFAASMLGVERAGSFLKEFRLMSMGRTTMTPLLALVAMCVYGDSQTGLPRTRAELFELFVDNAIVRGNEKHSSDGVNRDERADLIAMLAKMALFSTERSEPFTLDDVRRHLGSGWPRAAGAVAEVSVKEGFTRAGLHSGLLTVDKEDRVVWWHASVREYLTARALADGPEDERLQKLKLCNEPQWLETIVMMLLILSVRHYRCADRNPDVTKYFNELSMQSDAGLVMYFALADGAAVDSRTERLVIGNLVDGAIRLGQMSECREFNEELALQGRSPIQLLMKLRRTPRAVEGIAAIRDHPDVMPWMREEARAALARG